MEHLHVRLKAVYKTQQRIFWNIGQMYMERLNGFSMSILKLSEVFLYVTFSQLPIRDNLFIKPFFLYNFV